MLTTRFKKRVVLVPSLLPNALSKTRFNKVRFACHVMSYLAFHINSGRLTRLFCISHFVCLKVTFDGISDNFRSIRNFFLKHFYKMSEIRRSICKFWTKWQNAILDVRNLFFLQNGRRRSYWISEIHFRSHFWPFKSIRNFIRIFF